MLLPPRARDVTRQQAEALGEVPYVPGQPVVKFFSNAVVPLNVHSNFHRAPFMFHRDNINEAMVRACPQIRTFVPAEGCIFNSNEHLYQALGSDNQAAFMAFTSTGEFADYTIGFFVTLIVNGAMDLPKKHRPATVANIELFARCKYNRYRSKGNTGIVPKLISNMTAVLHQRLFPTMRFNYARLNALTESDMRSVWLVIHRLKYESYANFRTALVNTGTAYLLEFVRGAERVERNGQSDEIWGGLVHEDDVLYGLNRMGRYLMATRTHFANQE